MTKKTLDKHLQSNYLNWITYISKLYPKYRSKVPDNIIECYCYMVRRGAHEQIKDENGLRAYFTNWVYTRNFNFFVKKKEEPIDVTTLDLTHEEMEDITSLRIESVRNIVNNFSLDEQVLYYARYADGLTVKQLSEKFKIKPKTLYSQLNKLKNNIKTQLKTQL